MSVTKHSNSWAPALGVIYHKLIHAMDVIIPLWKSGS